MGRFQLPALVASAVFTTIVAAAAPTAFTVESITFKEPISISSNYYFNITVSDGTTTGYCYDAFGAGPTNGGLVTSGSSCSNDIDFSISSFWGPDNFTLGLSENYGGGTYSGTVQIDGNGSTSATPGYICDAAIVQNPASPVYNAACTLTAGHAISVPVTDTISCYVSLYFPVLKTAQPGDNVYVTGNITELGSWNDFTFLDGSPYTDDEPLFNGTTITIPSGSYPDGAGFEYKYRFWPKNFLPYPSNLALVTWEDPAYVNRVFKAPAGFWSSCDSIVVGQNPDVFGNYTGALHT